jgi:sarcosine oxidase subunit beta
MNGTSVTQRRADVVVIGAGVIGSAIAFELARRGRSVTVVDSGPSPGSGSTGASSAIIRFHYSTRDAVLTAWEAAAVWPDLGGHLGLPAGSPVARFFRTGCLVLDYPGTNRIYVTGLFDTIGVPYEDLTPGEIRDRYSGLDLGDYFPPRPVDDPDFVNAPQGELGGYFTPDAGFIDDPALAAVNFMDAASLHGAELRLRTRVSGILRQAGRVTGVELAGGGSIVSPIVVNAAGPGSRRVNEMAGVLDGMRISHRPLRQEVHVTEAPAGFGLESGTIVTDLDLGTYFRPHLAGTMIAGGTEPACDPLEWIDDPDDFDLMPTRGGFERNVYRVARRLPSVGIPHRPIGLAGLYDVSDDWVPLYDKTHLEGYYLACGTSGNQFKNAPMVGIFLAELIGAADRGQDHDVDPIRVRGERTGLDIDLGAFSRLRQRAHTSGTVLG